MLKKIEIDDLTRKIDIYSNDINRIRNHKNYLKSILKVYRCNRNKTDRELEDKINTLLHKDDRI